MIRQECVQWGLMCRMDFLLKPANLKKFEDVDDWDNLQVGIKVKVDKKL